MIDRMLIAPRTLKERQDGGEGFVLVDIRQEWERQVSQMEDAVWYPMVELPQRAREFHGLSNVVFFCHDGARSFKVVQWLHGLGMMNVCSLAGGIERWSQEVDSTVPRY